MKHLIIALLTIMSAASVAETATPVYVGYCSILRNPADGVPAKLLAYKDISLKPGQTETIYDDGHEKFQVSVYKYDQIYSIEAVITYGAPHFLGEGSASYSEDTMKAGNFPGVGVAVPGMPTFGCGPHPTNTQENK